MEEERAWPQPHLEQPPMLDLEVDGVAYCISVHMCMLDLEVVGWSSVLCQHACMCVC